MKLKTFLTKKKIVTQELCIYMLWQLKIDFSDMATSVTPYVYFLSLNSVLNNHFLLTYAVCTNN
jgi:hypothetical protein